MKAAVKHTSANKTPYPYQVVRALLVSFSGRQVKEDRLFLDMLMVGGLGQVK
jgi:hypothetical protein